MGKPATMILTRHQTDARIRQRARTIAAVPPQVDAHLAAQHVQSEPVVPRTRRLRDDPLRLAQFRQRYLASYRANESDRRVYFARLIDTDAVKIGFARDPEKRIKVLFRDYGIKAELVGTIPGDWYIENLLHRLFRRARVYHHRVPEIFTYSVVKDALAALIAAQPEPEEVSSIPKPSRIFNNAALDAAVVEMTMKRLRAAA